MGIDRTGPVGPSRFTGSQEEQTHQADRRRQQPAPRREDSINLSSEARRLAGADPAERDALVKRIRSQVQDGAYRVDPDAVARSIVDRGDA